MNGRVFKIKRFSVHDGPGIRTSVFLKGCPLNCTWCHAPEGISPEKTIWYDIRVCIACGECVRVCRKNALKLVVDSESHVSVDHKSCSKTGDCVKICPTGAIQFTGTEMSTALVISEIEKDMIFYRESGGGVTLTGGEPLFQPDFALEILQECRNRNIHTAIETSLYCETDTIKIIAGLVDLFLIDLKLFDSDMHIRYTGKSNEIIRNNFRYLAGIGKNIIVRIPMINGITDTEENKSSIAKFVSESDSRIPIEYIPYNPLAENNYIKLGMPFLL